MTSTTVPEHVRARHWREDIMKLSRPELAERIGLSVSAIVDYENGRRRGQNRDLTPDEYRTYRLACAAFTAGLEFDWLTCRAVITRTETVDLLAR